MSESEAMLHEANRRAHKAAKAAAKKRKAIRAFQDLYNEPEPKGSAGVADWWHRERALLLAAEEARVESNRALDAYEEIEERQQKEATL